jgi:predicted RNA-binding Zn-ribbon protein involved in translation (DUF1610 family)
MFDTEVSKMKEPIRSRHGLTRCTACRAHIRSSDRPSTTECPFCGATVSAGRPQTSLPSGRGGILAASLLALGGCGGPSAPPPEEPSHAETSAPATDDGSNDNDDEDADDGDERPQEQVQAPVAAYGIAPQDRYQTTPEQPPDEPMYGIAP